MFKRRKVKKMKKIIALLIAMLFVLLMFTSSIYIHNHAVHECHGAECVICQSLEQCRKLLTSVFTATVVSSYAFFAVIYGKSVCVRQFKTAVTPVLLKTKILI